MHRTFTSFGLALALCLPAACAQTTADDATGSAGAQATSDPTAQGSTETEATGTGSTTPNQGTGAAGTSSTTAPQTGASGAGASQAGSSSQAGAGPTAGSSGQTSTSGAVAPVTQADIQVGATVNDLSGQRVGAVESVDAQGAMVSTGTARAKIPFTSMGRTSTGLVTTATRAELESAQGQQQPQ